MKTAEFQQQVLDRLDRIDAMLEILIVRLQPGAGSQAPKPNIERIETATMGKTYVREVNHDTGETRNYVKEHAH